MKAGIQNHLSKVRKARGIPASELARRVDVSRQTIYAIENGTYVPNTVVALKLARELAVPVDELFSLDSDHGEALPPVEAEILSNGVLPQGRPVQITRIGSKTVGIPVSASPYYLPEADGVIAGSDLQGRVDLFSGDAPPQRIVLAGCDPAVGILSRMVEKATGIEVLSAPASSKLALRWLKQGTVHLAGSHLEDLATGEFNLPYLREEFAGQDLRIITFAAWEEGFVVAPGNPKGIRAADDLARVDIRFINREIGSGSRALLDRLLEKAGLSPKDVEGFDRVAHGHLAAAYGVLAGEADVCLATRSAARTFGLDFFPLHVERYDFAMRRETAEIPAIQSLLDILQLGTFRRKLEVLAGYDTAKTGSVLA